MDQLALDRWHMARALELARRGQGAVEPNPMVGCIVARGAELLGEGWHRRYGGPHAEIEALALARERARGATLYVTLEPCCHQGKTPPCTDAILKSGVRRVVAAMRDPFPAVDGGGFAQLQAAGVEVVSGVLEAEAEALNEPYLWLLSTARPWVIAKWAMTLDGKIATEAGDSRWISNECSRAIVHELRGRMDAILVGRGTVEHDDPLLTARPEGPRRATRVVLDSLAQIATSSQLVHTARDWPVLIAVSESAPSERRDLLRSHGCEVLFCQGDSHFERLDSLLAEMGRRRWTNVLIEGGAKLLGEAFHYDLINEVHAFIAPKLVGGEAAPSAIAGVGIPNMSAAHSFRDAHIQVLDGDVYVSGRLR
ncbi:MAG: bifunctional diaminohydroxyphosphoribosylaminopyrimidine deaminase/5-amino-6-(5-phosphoribosylamino)uracil reductase RibD [Planctomycetia bacterium]|nr:bifunctional diaminohydroxyphosphoribosylaminopyrimidine deaminase/5-amino-6-(5-phosphoribosylamino)uracil reductase RibD [Planctomycetia bacterium]